MLGGLVLVTRVCSQVFGAQGFGEYQIARRTLAVVAWPLMCGLGISLPRYIARDIGARERVATWMVSGLALASILMGIFLGLGIAASAQVGEWIFGSGSRRGLLLCMLVAVAGMICATLTSAAMRGLSRFRAAAALQVANGALAPLAAVLLASSQVERALLITGGLWIGISGVVFLQLSRDWKHPALSVRQIRGAVRELIVFGAPRVPGDMALFGLFALPAYAAVHRNDIVGAGFLSVGLSLVQAIATAFSSAGFVLLPYWSRAARDSAAFAVARKRTVALVAGSVLIATLFLALFELFLRPIARLLLGPLAQAGVHDLRYAMLAAVPYVIYLVLRDYFDAISVFPLNTLALGAAIGIQFALLNVRRLSVPVATAASFLALGLMMTALWTVSLRRAGGSPLASQQLSPVGAVRR